MLPLGKPGRFQQQRGGQPPHSSIDNQVLVPQLARWTGKDPNTTTTTIAFREALPMRVTLEDSWLDGRPAIVCSYGVSSPIPWRWVRDELRALDHHRLLRLTFVGGPWSKPLAAPLLLTRTH